MESFSYTCYFLQVQSVSKTVSVDCKIYWLFILLFAYFIAYFSFINILLINSSEQQIKHLLRLSWKASPSSLLAFLLVGETHPGLITKPSWIDGQHFKTHMYTHACKHISASHYFSYHILISFSRLPIQKQNQKTPGCNLQNHKIFKKNNL